MKEVSLKMLLRTAHLCQGEKAEDEYEKDAEILQLLATKSSTNPMESSEFEKALQWCPKWRQG